MSRIEKLRKKPVEVETMVWDGTDEAASAIKEWVGRRPGNMSVFMAAPEALHASEHAQLWVAHNDSWTPLPIGYRVAKELDGSGFYPLSPQGAAAGYEMGDATAHQAPDGAPWYAHLDGPCGPECGSSGAPRAADG